MKKLTLLLILGLAFTACETDAIEDATLNIEDKSKPEIIDVFDDTNHGLING